MSNAKFLYIMTVCWFALFLWQISIGTPWAVSTLICAIANLIRAIYETRKKNKTKDKEK